MKVKKILGARLRWALVFAFALMLLGGVVGGRASAQAAPNETGPGVGEKSTASSAVPEKQQEERDPDEKFRQSKSVQSIAHALGMEPDHAAMLFTGLNFLVLVGAVGYFVAKGLPKTFRARSTGIQKQLVEARTATEEAGARLKAVEARLGRLDEEIAGMRRQAEVEAQREEERTREAMEAERAKILAAAETEIRAATSAARRDLQRHAAELAVEQAARGLVITAETDRRLVQGFAQRLAESKGGQN